MLQFEYDVFDSCFDVELLLIHCQYRFVSTWFGVDIQIRLAFSPMTIWPCSFNTNPRLMDTAQASKVLLSCLAEKDRALPWLDGGLTILAQMVQILEQAAAAGGGMPPSKDPGRTDSMVQILLQAGIPVGRRVAKGRVGATKANRRGHVWKGRPATHFEGSTDAPYIWNNRPVTHTFRKVDR